jgi:hypothetical protein
MLTERDGTMLHKLIFLTISPLLMMFLAACSSTTITGSWKNPDFSGSIRKIYIVGISKQETSRRIFEDEFGRKLQSYGVDGTPSYKDLVDPQNASKEAIAERVRKNGADSVLMARMVSKRTEEVVTPGRITTYGARPYYGYPHPYTPDPYYRNWGSYYDRGYDTIYEPATVTQFQVVTIEANLYDANSSELIWSAQLDTVIEANTQKLIADFVDSVTKELRQQGLL